MTGPDAPGYHPTFDAGDPRRVGHGSEFGADLYALYRAGRTRMPEVAGWFATMAVRAQAHQGRLEPLVGATGRPAAMCQALDLLEELNVALYRSALAIRDTGAALVRLADDFAGTDADAAAEFDRLLGRNRDTFDRPTPRVPDPPRPDAPGPDAPGPDAPRPDAPRPDAPRPDAPLGGAR